MESINDTGYPVSFSIQPIKSEYIRDIWTNPNLSSMYEEFINYQTLSLNDLILNLKVNYITFLNSAGKFNYMFKSKTSINKILTDLYKNGRGGDIIEIGRNNYYIYGKKENRRISSIQFMQEPDGNVFPKEGLDIIEYYDIHELKDIDNYYPYNGFRWIEIPKEYFPPQLSDVNNNSLLFIINNKNGIDDYGYKNLPVISADIGNKYRHIIYLSIPLRSKYFEEFVKKPKTKI